METLGASASGVGLRREGSARIVPPAPLPVHDQEDSAAYKLRDLRDHGPAGERWSTPGGPHAPWALSFTGLRYTSEKFPRKK